MKYPKDPVYQDLISNKLKEAFSTPEVQERKSKAMFRIQENNPEFVKQRNLKIIEAWSKTVVKPIDIEAEFKAQFKRILKV